MSTGAASVAVAGAGTNASRAACVARDRDDPLGSLRDQFVLPDGVIYLDGNSLGALPRATSGRVRDAIESHWGVGLVRSWNDADWIRLPEIVGAKIARLIGARAHEVIATDSTSVNLFKVLSAALRIQREAAPGRSVIVSERSNFPTDLYMVQGLIEQLSAAGLEELSLELVDDSRALSAALEAGPALVLLTQVNYRTGALHDLDAITAQVHEAGALVIWDLAHSAGALPVDLEAAGADFAVGCGYKYLNGGPGAPAFVYVAERHQEGFRQPLSGWIGHASPFEFEPVYRPAPGVARYLCGTPPILSLVALDAGLDTLLAAESVGGLPALRAKSQALCELFIGLVEERCKDAGLTLITPRSAEHRGSQVSFAAPAQLASGYALMQALIARGVIGDFRAPNVLRFGFTPLYTRYVDVWDAVETLVSILDSRFWDQPAFHQKAAVT